MAALRKKTVFLFLIVAAGLAAIWFLSIYNKRIPAPTISTLPFTTSTTVAMPSSTVYVQASSTVGFKTYRNVEFGFEFQHPSNWKFEENSFYSPFSKFNLVGTLVGEGYLLPPILINIVTPDFADRAVVSRQNLGAIVSDVVIAGVRGKRYEYTEEKPQTAIDLPFQENRIILATYQEYEDVFNQILATLQFIDLARE